MAAEAWYYARIDSNTITVRQGESAIALLINYGNRFARTRALSDRFPLLTRVNGNFRYFFIITTYQYIFIDVYCTIFALCIRDAGKFN